MKQWILTSLALATLATGLGVSEGSLAQTSTAATPVAVTNRPLTLEQLFRAEPYRGEAAKDAKFSASGRYVAYLWNPFGEPGSDLYVHDTQTGKTLRLTSPTLMAAVETPENLERYAKKLQQKRDETAERQTREEAQAAYLRGEAVDLEQWERKAIEALKVELAERKARDDARKAAEKAAWGDAAVAAAAPASGASAPEAKKPAKDPKDMALWELRDELKKKREREKLKPEDLYPGVSQFVWASKGEELVLAYRGQLLRWKAGSERAEPLLATGRTLKPVAYAPDDQFLIVQDETRVLRVRLATAGIEVINRELFNPDDEERKFKIAQTAMSEDGRWMALVANAPLVGADGKPLPKPGRQVEIMNFNDRWATAKKVDREVSDDKRGVPSMAIYIRKVPAPGAAPERQPQPVFTHPGGDSWFEISPVVWARDGSVYAFTTFEREKDQFRVYLGKPGEAKPEMVLERRAPLHHELVNVMTPSFTPDSKQLVLILADNGWRQPYAMSLAAGADRSVKPLLTGEFEAFQVLGLTPDAKTMFVVANKDDYAAMNVWRVDLKDGRMTALGRSPDYHRNAVVARNGQWAAAVAGNWAERPELKLLKGQAPAAGAEAGKLLTQSHDPAWAQVDVLRPERFSFKNRHGDTIPAYVFKPLGWAPSDKRAAIVYTYGGPLNDRHSVETDSFQPTGYVFAMYMAAKHGYVTVTVDPRGHSNYGEKFADANWEKPGAPQTEDLEDLAAYMKANLGVDGARIGLNGWSFGGFQTQYTMYTRPDLFAAGIAGAGPTEWENYNSWYSGRTIGKVDRTKPVLRKYSLLPLAKNLRKPLLLVHGMQDPNVLYQDTVNVYRALLESGKEGLVELFLDPDGEHALGGAVKAVGWHRKYEQFWLRNLGPAQQK
ncbi:prolyl oligopeptidase family serine peptidase [Roseateles chitinivorans]|uniref:S9 family peptidase n=1 Tax=Roseateles chitinivorans TaxID=2917965 RepID=UPI003D67EA8D